MSGSMELSMRRMLLFSIDSLRNMLIKLAKSFSVSQNLPRKGRLQLLEARRLGIHFVQLL